MAANRLSALAIAAACVAAVVLTIALVRRCGGGSPAVVATGSGSGDSDDVLPRPQPQALIESTIVSMFDAVCRHEVACGIGDAAACANVVSTMKQMPKTLAIKPCARVDADEAARCIDELRTRSCDDFAKSLDVLDLQAALDRVRTCRRACE